VAERVREKEVIRLRLVRLCDEVPSVLTSIEAVIDDLHDANDPTSFDRLDDLISDQAYRLSSWKVAAEEINYRRFFDVNSLAAIRIELPEVFDATHRLLLEWIESGAVHGVRIDHIDAWPITGISAHPSGSGGCGPWRNFRTCNLPPCREDPRFRREAARRLPVDGTTGYEFATQVNGILIDRGSEKLLTDTYNALSGGSSLSTRSPIAASGSSCRWRWPAK